ncbi:MAG: sigma-54 dependent transcriptional regulator, partial [Woeseiaceae bacterium]
MPTALIVDQDMDNLLRLSGVFRDCGFSVETAQDLRSARDLLLKRMPEVALFDEQVAGEDAIVLLEQLDLADVVEIYLMSEQRSLNSASRAMRVGVSDYFSKPVDEERLATNLRAVASDTDSDTASENVAKSGRGLLIGESPPMRRLYRLIRKCAPSNASILLTGESGAGKELVARTIHNLSERSDKEMVAINCSAVPGELMESELFGHRKGSFTGATKNHRGFFQRATGSTLFLDEITEMDPGLQAKLLRVLEVSKVRPVGSEKDIDVDARIVAATNQDPVEAVADGRLREDLYYRLAQFPLHVPALRDKGDDIASLANFFLEQQNESTGIEKSFEPEVLDAFQLHEWPGNVRELKNAVIHGHLLAGDVIRVDDLPN